MRYAELTPELERDLATRYQAGDRDAGAELLDAHWPILVRLMRSLFRRGVDDADVMQTACAEFLSRVLKWDRSPSCRLTSWASQGAFYATKTAVWEDTTIRVSEYALTQRTKFRKTGTDIPDGLALQLAMRTMAGLDDLVGEGEGDTIAEVTPSNDAGPESSVADREATARRSVLAAAALGCIDERETEIIRRQYLEDESETLRAIGRDFGLSQTRTQQVSYRARQKMASAVRAIMSEDDAILWGGEWRQPKRREMTEAA